MGRMGATESERDLKDRLYGEAKRMAHSNRNAPKCSVCGNRLVKDGFNGMWVCNADYSSQVSHGGYQTESQNVSAFYRELLEAEGLQP